MLNTNFIISPKVKRNNVFLEEHVEGIEKMFRLFMDD